jgi:hypothetical protein
MLLLPDADTNFRTFTVFDVYTFPAYVKQADAYALHDPEAYKEVEATSFGDRVWRRFPATTKAACWLSWAHFLNKREHVKHASTVEYHLTALAERHGITDDVIRLREEHQALSKDATADLPDSSFMLIIDDGGTKQRLYPLRNPAEVKEAATWLMTYRDELPFSERHDYAVKIRDKMAEFGTGLSEDLAVEIERQAGRGVYDPQEAAQMLRNRAKAARYNMCPDIRQKLAKLAQAVESKPALALNTEHTIKLCSLVDQFDRFVHLDGK